MEFSNQIKGISDAVESVRSALADMQHDIDDAIQRSQFSSEEKRDCLENLDNALANMHDHITDMELELNELNVYNARLEVA